MYFRCFQNSCIVQREHAVRYRKRQHFDRRVFKRLATRLRRTGCAQAGRTRTRKRGARNEDNVINLLAYIEANPQGSTREISSASGISESSINRIFR